MKQKTVNIDQRLRINQLNGLKANFDMKALNIFVKTNKKGDNWWPVNLNAMHSKG